MKEKAKTRKSWSNSYEITSPIKEVFQTNNLKDFCKNHNLRYKSMIAVSSGLMKSHRGGWSCNKLKK